MKFLKYVLATLVALIIFSGVGLIFFFGFIGLMTAEPAVNISDSAVLYLPLDKQIAERSFDDPLSDLGYGGASSIGILDLKEAIEQAKTDDKIKGIYLDVNSLMAGFGQAYELREALKDFKESDKFIYAYSDYMSEGSYYVASVADSIFLHPEGNLDFNGLSYGITFFKGAMEKLDIHPQIFRVGDYKSAVEPFIRKDMSEENREQVGSFINGIYDNILRDIADSRNMDHAELKAISVGMKARNTDLAKELGLTDGTMYSDEVADIMRKRLGLEEDAKIDLVSFGKYRRSYGSTSSSSSNRIAVIVASGEIIFGDGDQNSVGADKFIKEIRKARKSSRIKAIVLRINSPGGNFIASDELWREITLASEEKPVIASMSNYAASGGYYMAMAADTIVAYPNTITGSIGIFSMLFDMSDFMENKLGITSDRVNTGEFSDILTVSRPLTDSEKSIFQNQAEEGYETFITKAAEGRGMTPEEILAIASGRVWTGTQARDNGLVDELGNFDDAVQIAAEKAGIEDDYSLRFYPIQKTFWEQILQDLGQDVQMRIMEAQAGDVYPYIDLLKKVRNYQGVQARMPFDLVTEF